MKIKSEKIETRTTRLVTVSDGPIYTDPARRQFQVETMETTAFSAAGPNTVMVGGPILKKDGKPGKSFTYTRFSLNPAGITRGFPMAPQEVLEYWNGES